MIWAIGLGWLASFAIVIAIVLIVGVSRRWGRPGRNTWWIGEDEWDG